MRAMWTTVAVIAVGLGGTAAARADTLLKGAAGANPIPQGNVKVTGIKDGQLSYTTATGAVRTAALTDVQKLTIDGQAGFNAAEDAFASRNVPGATDAYAAVMNGAGPDWIKVRAAHRLAGLARTQQRYDLQVAAYAALVKSDPASAADARPAAPAANAANLDAAQTALTRAVSSVPAAQRTPLLGVQLDIARAKGDKAAVASTLQQLSAAGGASPADQAMLKLAAADVALDAKQYAQAESTVTANKGLFTDPAQQVDALYVLAQAKDGQSPAAAGDAAKDVALAYMRVVAFGDALPDRPHVAESMARAAELTEKVGDAKGALTLYQRLASDKAYAGSPAIVDAAKKGVARLKK